MEQIPRERELHKYMYIYIERDQDQDAGGRDGGQGGMVGLAIGGGGVLRF